MPRNEGYATVGWQPFAPLGFLIAACEVHGAQLHRICHKNRGIYNSIKLYALRADSPLGRIVKACLQD
jgi:hypothetical protein